MSKNTSILLGDRYEKFIAKQVSNGKYNSASEVIRTALRLLEEEEEMKNILIGIFIKIIVKNLQKSC